MIPNGRGVPYFPLKLSEADGYWEVRALSDDTAYKINPAATEVLALCDGVRTEPEIIALLCSRYRVSAEECRKRVAKVLDPLTEDGLVWWRARRMEQMTLPAPPSVFWELTWRCNLRCVHCVVSGGERREVEPTTRELKGIAWQLARAGVRSVTYSGGEPLLRPDFFEIAQHVADLGMTAQIATNGLLITEAIAAEFARLKLQTQIAINSACATGHDTFTQIPGSWKRSLHAVELLLAAGVPVTIATVATKLSVAEIPAIMESAAALGVSLFRLIPFVPAGRGKKYREIELSPREMRELTERIRRIRDSGLIQVLPMEFEETLDRAPGCACSPETRIGCDGAVGYCTIGTTGEVLPCSFFSGVAADSLRDRPFEWIWRNSRFLNYFRSLTVGDLEGHCVSCDHLAVCRGGCRATNGALGVMFAENSHCWLGCGRDSAHFDDLAKLPLPAAPH